ncbi:MAG: DUF4352 domain-containing protein [Polyangiaceae bacterium]
MIDRRAGMRGILLLIGLLAVLLACKAKAEPEPKLGEVITFDDSQWTVVKAEVLGNTLQGIGDLKKTAGKFVKVEFTVTNKSKQSETIFDHPKVIDEQNREYMPIEGQSLYLGDRDKSLTLESLSPDMMQRFVAIYEIPADSNGLRFEARALSAFGKRKKVALGI